MSKRIAGPADATDALNALVDPGYLAEAIHRSPNIVAVFDKFDRLAYANQAFRKAYDITSEGTLTWHDIIQHAFAGQTGPAIETDDIGDWLIRADTLRGTLPFRSFEAEFHDGRWFMITEAMQPDGSLFLLGVDISRVKGDTRALRDERDRAVRAAWTDPLTGLANRRYCLDQLKAWRERARPEEYGTLAIIDLDHFKEINDEYGHETGDRVLVDFGRKMLEHVRLQDLFGRIGGEEFLLFMPDCDAADGVSRIENLLLKLRTHAAINEIPDFRYGFSGGVVLLRACDDIAVALQLADEALYEAKLAGRARVCLGGIERRDDGVGSA